MLNKFIILLLLIILVSFSTNAKQKVYAYEEYDNAIGYIKELRNEISKTQSERDLLSLVIDVMNSYCCNPRDKCKEKITKLETEINYITEKINELEEIDQKNKHSLHYL